MDVMPLATISFEARYFCLTPVDCSLADKIHPHPSLWTNSTSIPSLSLSRKGWPQSFEHPRSFLSIA
jgi:hypothetical protein